MIDTKPTLSDAIGNDFAKRREGFRALEVIGFPLKSVQRMIQLRVKSGLLHRAQISYKNVRYFGSARDAMECVTDSPVIQYRAPRVSPGESWKNVQASNPNNVKPIICPPCPDRYAVTGRVTGGFATMGIGRYL